MQYIINFFKQYLTQIYTTIYNKYNNEKILLLISFLSFIFLTPSSFRLHILF